MTMTTIAPSDTFVDVTDVAIGQSHSTTVTVVEPIGPETKRSVNGIRRSDVLSLVGSFVAAICLTGLLFTQVAPFGGVLGFMVMTYVFFIGLYGVLVSFDEKGTAVRDRIAAAMIHGTAAMLIFGLVVIIGYTLFRGYSALVHANFFTQDMSDAGPLDPLTVGGIAHAMVGTLIMISIALAIVIPLGITCAIYLNEVPGKFSRFVRTIAEAMSALPSVIAGLFIYATWILILGRDKSGFAASLAISVMMLPIIIRASDVVIRLVPGTLKEASYALGSTQWRTVWHVVLPTTRSGLTTAVILGTARGIGETSPVLLTAGFTAALNTNPFNGPMVSLPLETFQLVQSPQQTLIERGFGCAAALMLLVLVLFVIARIIGGRGPGQLNRRQQKSRAAASIADERRFAHRDAARNELSPAPPNNPIGVRS